jgi:hypothetical protein
VLDSGKAIGIVQSVHQCTAEARNRIHLTHLTIANR